MAEQAELAGATGTRTATGSRCRGGRCRYVAAAVLAVVAGLSAWWLFTKGEEGVPAQAMVERPSAMLPGAAPSGPSPHMPMGAPGAAAPQLPALDVMAQKLAARLEKEPADGEGWALLARTYLELGDVAKADAAYAKALALRPDDEAMKADFVAARKALKPVTP